MRIAIFTDTFYPQINGVTKTLQKLVNQFETDKIDYIIFAPKEQGIKNNQKVIRFFSLPFILYPECRFTFPLYPSIEKTLKNFKPDLIHIVTPFSVGLCGLYFAKTYKVPLVNSYHTNFDQYLKYFHLSFLHKLSWNYMRWFHSHSLKNYCPSKATLETLQMHGINNLDIWTRGIDTYTFSPQHRDEAYRNSLGLNDKLIFLYVGRMSKEKDLDIFMDVAQKLNEKYKNSIHFLMVGEGPLLNKFKNFAMENMTFTGFLHGENLSKVYASSDVFLFPSSTETLGNVILEAMASSLAVVACDAGGVKDNLIHRFNGIACSIRNEVEFYKACEKLINNRDLLKKLQHNARLYTLNKSWNHIFSELINSYQEVIEAKKQLNEIFA